MKKIIYTKSNGNLAVVTPAPKEHLERVFGPLSDEMYAHHVWERSVPEDAINPRDMEEEEFEEIINQNYDFFLAYFDDGSRIRADMVKAREIHMNHIRFVRNKKLEALDVEQLKKSNPGDIAAVHERKQILRDIPQNIDLSVAKDLAQLRDIWPHELK